MLRIDLFVIISRLANQKSWAIDLLCQERLDSGAQVLGLYRHILADWRRLLALTYRSHSLRSSTDDRSDNLGQETVDPQTKVAPLLEEPDVCPRI